MKTVESKGASPSEATGRRAVPLTPEQEANAALIRDTRRQIRALLSGSNYVVEGRIATEERLTELFSAFQGMTGITREEILAQHHARQAMNRLDRERMVYGRMGSGLFYETQDQYFRAARHWSTLLSLEQSKVERAIRRPAATSTPIH